MKKLMIILCTIAFMLCLTACGNSPSGSGGEKAKLQPLTVGLMPDVDSIPFIIAQEKGFFAEEGLTVTLEQFKSALDRDSAFQSGKLDGAVSDMLAEAFAKDGGFSTVITSLSSGSYKMVVGKDEPASSVQELQGKDVALSKNTIIEYVTDKILKEQGMTPDSIHKIVIPQIPTRLEMLRNNKVAAATLPEPMASLAVQSGAKVINSSDKLNIRPGVLLFTTKAVKEKEKELQALYRAYNKAVEYLNKEPKESYIDLIVTKGGFPPAVKEVLVLPAFQKASAPAPKDVADVVAWLQERKLIKNNYTYEDLVDTRFVR